MKKKRFLRVIIITILITLSVLFLTFTTDPNFGNYLILPEQTHSHTKAICTLNNYCQDFEIFCNNEQVIGMRFTGAAVQFPLGWQDPRNEETRERMC